MARYIDADALKENLNEIARHSFTLDDGYQYFIKGLIRADDAINEIPTAAVVEVVRCKDCKHLEIINGPHIYARCNLHEFPIISFGVIDTREWFCADGERRDDGGES